MPAGYRVEYGGQFESEQSASQRLLALSLLAIAGVFMLLVLAFGKARDALIVMVNLPLALIGGVVGVLLSGGVLNVATMIGFITLFGIATRNGIMLVTHIHHLMNVDGVRDFREAVKRGAQERLVRILMDCRHRGTGVDAVGPARGPTGQRDSDPDGHCHSLRPDDVDPAQHVRRAGALPEVRIGASCRQPSALS
jgi:Cu/Ag efflux pump CusA